MRRCASGGCRHGRWVSRASSQLRNCDISSNVSALVATIVPIPGRKFKKRERGNVKESKKRILGEGKEGLQKSEDLFARPR